MTDRVNQTAPPSERRAPMAVGYNDTVHVNCGACHACCRNQLVTLQPIDDPTAYDCHVMETPSGPLFALKLKTNGDCVYLGPDGCTIHGKQPAICRAFDCASFAALWPRSRRRAEGLKVDGVFRAGMERLRQQREKANV